MAKKSRRTRAVNRGTAPVQRLDSKQSQPAASTVTRGAAKPVSLAATVAQQPENYNYVKGDLVRIGVIAGALILIIVVLTFIPALR
jgi:hypothetical protein